MSGSDENNDVFLIAYAERLMLDVCLASEANKLSTLQAIATTARADGASAEQIRTIQLLVIAFGQGRASRESNTTNVFNGPTEVLNNSGNIVGSALGDNSSVKARDVSATLSMNTESKQLAADLIAQVRESISQQSDPEFEELKAACLTLLEKIEQESQKESPSVEVCKRLWSGLKAMGGFLATAKPFIELGKLLMCGD